MDTDDNFNTTDLSLAAFLIAKNYTLVQITRDARHHRFLFSPRAKEAAPGFFLNEPVGARDFASALRQLKSAIHAV